VELKRKSFEGKKKEFESASVSEVEKRPMSCVSSMASGAVSPARSEESDHTEPVLPVQGDTTPSPCPKTRNMIRKIMQRTKKLKESLAMEAEIEGTTSSCAHR
jgi:hypothetical protein